ncbi:murein L,D-transpeptidase [Amorphus sp. 3PC139-8]|uniref:L,D-transpeptidase family protein n=1 Tax=Amorphus sp. 3PC139-8 TaxID=2735676 RepID=UPI00345DFD93
MRIGIWAGILAALLLVPSAASALPTGPAELPTASETREPEAVDLVPRSSDQSAIEALLTEPTAAADSDLRYRDAILAFYEDRDFRPVWIVDGALTPAAESVIARLSKADTDGLDPKAYEVDRAMLDTGPHPDAPDLATTELSLSDAVIAFAHDAQSGRIDPRRISSIITLTPPVPDPLVSLKRVASSSNPVDALDAFNPPHPQFRALKAALAAERASEIERPEPVPSGRNLRLGDSDPRVGLLRQRLGATLHRGSDVSVYDEGVVEAVKAFQSEHGLRPDGIVGPNTLAVMNRGLERDREADILVNMERWRWMPRDLGATYVFVNIPEFKVRIQREGALAYEGRVVVGKSSNPTPTFSDEIEHLVVNPYWNVPYSIASKEMLSSIQKNPEGYFASRGYEVVSNGRVVSPSSISWSPAALRHVRIRQKPGRGNALGNIKFMFPNEHAVYLHDTPSRNLFSKPVRAFSHGCVRVDQPLDFADALLAEEPHWNASQIKKLIGGGERYITLDRHIPVHLAYFTLWAEDDGTLDAFGDVYGYDRRVEKALSN